MTASKSLPARPSLDSLRKQAKKLARDVAAGDDAALARVRRHLPNLVSPLTQRNAQLIIAREYGFVGWQELAAEVGTRLGNELEAAVAVAARVIHDNDVERLMRLLAEHPALLSWQGSDSNSEGGLLGFATGAYADAGDAQREEWFTRRACAEALIDAGAVVTPSVNEGLLSSRANGLLQLFHGKGLLPRTLKFAAALGDLDAVQAALDEKSHDLKALNEAFVCACRFDRQAVASLLLAHLLALDSELRENLDASIDRPAFIKSFAKTSLAEIAKLGLWKPFVMEQVWRALHDNDVAQLVQRLKLHSWLLGKVWVDFQRRLIEASTLETRRPHGKKLVAALLDLEPAILRHRPPPPTQAIENTFTYGSTDMLPLLTRIWPIPDDLPHAAGIGDLERVKSWFDAAGKPALADVANHQPATSVHPREPQWGDVGVQQVLDTALAWAVINRHFDVADFLLAHGANVNTTWNSHEPASILHHLVFLHDPYESMQYLIDRGIDMTIKDYRWHGTAVGWARVGNNDEKMAQWLEDADRRRQLKR